MTTQIKLPKTAKNNHHFFEAVLYDLYNKHTNALLIPDPTKVFCKNQTGNLKYDGFNIYSYDQRIFYKDYGLIHNSYNLDIQINQSLDKKTVEKIKKHFDYLLEFLEKRNYHYDLGFGPDDDDFELLKANPKRHWLFHNIKCSVVKVKDTCSIDLEEYDELIKTECGHLFNDKNLHNWLNEHHNKTCPLCRTKLW